MHSPKLDYDPFKDHENFDAGELKWVSQWSAEFVLLLPNTKSVKSNGIVHGDKTGDEQLSGKQSVLNSSSENMIADVKPPVKTQLFLDYLVPHEPCSGIIHQLQRWYFHLVVIVASMMNQLLVWLVGWLCRR